MKKTKLFAAFLSALMTMSISFSASAQLNETQENCPDFAVIKEIDADSSVFDTAVEKINKICENPDDYSNSDMIQQVEILISEYEKISTLINVYDIACQSDVLDTDAQYEYMEANELSLEMYDKISECILNLCNAGFERKLYNVSGYNMVDTFTYINAPEDNSDADDKNSVLIMEIEELINEYYSYTSDSFTAEFDGRTWTDDDLLNDSIYSENELAEIAKEINHKRNETLGNIFLEILKKRHEIALNSGYENYAEYAYNTLYLRDYTLEDSEKIYDTVKNTFGSFYYDIIDGASVSANNSGLVDMTVDSSTLSNILADFLSDFDNDYLNNFNHMKSHHLYQVTNSDYTSGNCYSTSLYEYSVPFMFIYAYEDFSDISSIFHEFGHANAEYLSPSSAIYDMYSMSLDVAEIHSQGLEILFAQNNNSNLTEDQKSAFKKYILMNLTDSIVQGCLFDEFQKYAYEHPYCTLNDLNQVYYDLCQEYGIGYSDENFYEYDWVEIPHNFDSPFYYMSYATSAASVLDLWLISENDYDKAKDIYKNIASIGTYVPYMDAVNESGLSTIFDTNTMEEIAYQIGYYFGNNCIDDNYTAGDTYNNDKLDEYDNIGEFLEDTFDSPVINKDPDSLTAEETRSLMILTFVPIAIASAVCLAALIIIIIVIRHSDKKKAQKKAEMFNQYQ